MVRTDFYYLDLLKNKEDVPYAIIKRCSMDSTFDIADTARTPTAKAEGVQGSQIDTDLIFYLYLY